MAEGEKTIDVTQYPDSFQYVNIVMHDHQGIGGVENCALFYADREVVVDSIVLHTDSATDANDVISIKSFANLGDVDSSGDVIYNPLEFRPDRIGGELMRFATRFAKMGSLLKFRNIEI